MGNTKLLSALSTASLALLIASCGGGGDGDNKNYVKVKGVVSAPGGQVAFNRPAGLQRFFASILGPSAYAAIEGVLPVGAGVSVKLIEVDANGAQVGDPLAATTTDANGAFTLNAPEGFTPAPKYIVRAEGTTSTLDARLVDLAPNVDPVTNAASLIISEQASLAKLTVGEVLIIDEVVKDAAQDADPTGLDSAALSNAIKSKALTNEDSFNTISSNAAGGQICGTVRDNSGTGLPGIDIQIQDYGDRVTRARTITDSSGNYCVNVPVAGTADTYISGRVLSGDYIIGALNFTSASMAASQWWTSTSSTKTDGSGGVNNQTAAGKVSIPDANTVIKDFYLEANGARIEGTVTNSVNSGAVEGMKVIVRDYDTFRSLAGVPVDEIGNFRINVKPADYLISFRNKTIEPYASEVWRNGTDGVSDRNLGSRETVTAGTTYTNNAVLDPGARVSGTVKDDQGVPVPGIVVKVDVNGGGHMENLRTDKNGEFRLWVDPRLGVTGVPYTVQARGQNQSADTNGADDNTVTHFKLTDATGLLFDKAVAKITGTLISSDGNATPVGEANMRLVRVTTDNGTDTGSVTQVSNVVSQESSNSDGTFTLYAAAAGTYVVAARMDDDPNYGSGVYDGSKISGGINLSQGNVLYFANLPNDRALATLQVPTLSIGNGVGYISGNTGLGSNQVIIRLGGTGNAGGADTNNLLNIQTRGDGSFKVTMPFGTYDRLRATGPVDVNCDSVSVTNGNTTTLTITGTGVTGSCTITP